MSCWEPVDSWLQCEHMHTLRRSWTEPLQRRRQRMQHMRSRQRSERFALNVHTVCVRATQHRRLDLWELPAWIAPSRSAWRPVSAAGRWCG